MLHKLFHLNIEKNVPSTYSAFQLVLASLASILCFKIKGNVGDPLTHFKYAWLGAALILFYMGLDEYFSFHEDAGTVLGKSNLIPSDFLMEFKQYGYAWTIVGVGLIVTLGLPLLFLFYRIFFGHRYLYYLLILSGGVFVLGAIGMENLQVYLFTHEVHMDRRYILMLEELFEMTGVSLAIFVFLRFYNEQEPNQRVLG